MADKKHDRTCSSPTGATPYQQPTRKAQEKDIATSLETCNIEVCKRRVRPYLKTIVCIGSRH